jgi:hypothetical protein
VRKPKPLGDGLVRKALTGSRERPDEVYLNVLLQVVWKEDGNMKNNGRKIFFAIVMAALSSLPLIVMAGTAASKR